MSAFFAYPSRPGDLVRVIRSALEKCPVTKSGIKIESWEENDIAGKFIRDPIVSKISSCEFLVADTTFSNFNVYYEIGYAIACKKRPILTKYNALQGDAAKNSKITLLDSIGYEGYNNPDQLASFLENASAPNTTLISDCAIDTKQPVYYLRTPTAVDFDIQTLSRLKKSRLPFRVHDPEESGPLSALNAIDNISKSHGVIMHLLPATYREADSHNLSMAFCAGIAHGLNCITLIMQAGSDPVPLDYRDFVDTWTNTDQIENLIGSDFAPKIYEKSISHSSEDKPVSKTGLQKVNLGSSSAENEFGELSHYFLSTDEYLRILRGEIQVAAGRKGSGKTAIFSQTRNTVRRNKKNIVLDLQPEGSQLLKMKDILLSMLNQGTKEHTIVAFWEYLLLLELCHKLLHKDRQVHTRNHELYTPYRELSDEYQTFELAREGDFAERMLALVDVIHEQAVTQLGTNSDEKTLTNEDITRLLYKHDIHELRNKLATYLQHKEDVWILFDNLDKGWSAFGVEPDDILLLRCLQSALQKIQRELTKKNIYCRSTLFLRNDILEHLVDHTPDRGKLSTVRIDWADPELLREIIRKRLVYSLDLNENISFGEAWSQIAITHYKNEESSQYLIDRSLMRPRSLLDLIQMCLSHAVNVGNTKITDQNFQQGEQSYSSSLVDQIGFELRDILPEAEDILYAFIGANNLLSHEALSALINDFKEDLDSNQIIQYLLWYGVIGFVDPKTAESKFIYHVQYDMKRLNTLVTKAQSLGDAYFSFNLGFHLGLDIVP